LLDVERPRAYVLPVVSLASRSATEAAGVRSMAGAGRSHGVHFLDACFLCRKPLAGNRDIFMYRYVPSDLSFFPCYFPFERAP
jgi:hypothetical protein